MKAFWDFIFGAFGRYMGDPLSGTVESPLVGHLCIILMLESFFCEIL